jgi:hypothetical protein
MSVKLSWLLIIRGIARLITPIYVLWGIVDWYDVHPVAAVVFGALTFNYVIVYVLQWVARSLVNGPWRIQPWQSFVLLINVIALPVTYRIRLGHVPWAFVAVGILFVIGLYVGTVIYFYIQQRAPMADIFARRRSAEQAGGQPAKPDAEPAAGQ